jgi:transposase
MGRIKTITLSHEEQQALEQGYLKGKTHSYRQRCRGILLKSEGKKSADVASELKCNAITVNNWLNRYQAEGLAGLVMREGRGRKAILEEADDALVKELVAKHRQKLSLARVELERALGKSFSDDTLRRHVKKTLAVINESESVPSRSRVRSSIASKSRP